MALESVVVVCPDVNVRLWPTRVAEAAMGGGKSSILQLASAWARLGHPVTVAGAAVREGRDGFEVVDLSRAAGRYDVAIYVTGSLGHFRDPSLAGIRAATSLFWVNGPGRVEPPRPAPDWSVAPAKFLARRAIEEWGFPPARVVVIPGEAVRARRRPEDLPPRDPFAAVYASHPFKGLKESLEVLGRARARFAAVRLDVFGSERLWSDGAQPDAARELPDWARAAGELPQSAVEEAMPRYGVMPYLTEWVDGFSLSTAEALAGGVVVIATAHGANAELVRHGWNGFLVSSHLGKPDLDEAGALLDAYFSDPAAFEAVRARAMASVPTWDEQARDWRALWRSRPPGGAR